MKPNKKQRSDIRFRRTLAGVFVFVTVATVAIYYLTGPHPSPEEACAKHCIAPTMEGHMVRVYPATMTGNKAGPMTCKCFSAGSYNPIER